MLVKEVVPPKASLPILSTVSGISIEVKIMLFASAEALISVTLGACVFQSAKVISVLLFQPILLTTCILKIVALLGG